MYLPFLGPANLTAPRWQGYSLGAAQLSFALTVRISGGSNQTQALNLSPAAPFAASDDGTVVAELLGDLASYSAMPDFGTYILMMLQAGSAVPCSQAFRVGPGG